VTTKPKSKTARWQTDASLYRAALEAECERLKIDPLKAIESTDRYPRLQKIPMVEFMIGWFDGVATCLGISIEELWEQS
jgi:hypothetical protein